LPQDRPARSSAYLVLLAGVLAVSCASIFVRLAQAEGAPSLSIAAGRLGLAALLLTPLALKRAGREIGALTRRQVLAALAAGACLAVHFAVWITSLAFTSVASSAALVTTIPLWVGLASWLILKEKQGPGVWLGLGLTVLGSLLIGLSDRGGPASRPLLGDGLALAGALAFCGYALIGRGLRARLSTLAYVWLAYGSAALVLLAWLFLSGGGLTGLTGPAWLCILALAVIPQLIGHTSLAWALRHLSATFVTVALLGEPIGAAVLAFVIFGEGLAPLQAGGFGALLGGIYLAGRGEAREIKS